MATIGRPTSEAIAVIVWLGFMNLVMWMFFPCTNSLINDGVEESEVIKDYFIIHIYELFMLCKEWYDWMFWLLHEFVMQYQ